MSAWALIAGKGRYLEHLSVSHHGGAVARNVKVALEELPVDGGIRTRVLLAVYSGDLVALHVGDAVLRQVPGERDCQVITQAQLLSTCNMQCSAC